MDAFYSIIKSDLRSTCDIYKTLYFSTHVRTIKIFQTLSKHIDCSCTITICTICYDMHTEISEPNYIDVIVFYMRVQTFKYINKFLLQNYENVRLRNLMKKEEDFIKTHRMLHTEFIALNNVNAILLRT